VDGCQIHYYVVNDALHISDLTGNMSTFGSISLLNPNGTLRDLVNSNCQVLGTGSKVTFPGNVSKVLDVHLRLGTGSGDPPANPAGSRGFIGQQNIYWVTTMAAQLRPGPYQSVWTWTAFPVPEPNHCWSIIARIRSIRIGRFRWSFSTRMGSSASRMRGWCAALP
jgi:hypothetical protein